MTKLEILSAYLPYNIELIAFYNKLSDDGIVESSSRKRLICFETGVSDRVSISSLFQLESIYPLGVKYKPYLLEYKPLLRPLSKLNEQLVCELFLLTTKIDEMPEDYKFILTDLCTRIEWMHEDGELVEWIYVFADQTIISDINVFDLPAFFRRLLKDHFDVFGLIGKGEAIILK